jgi:biotin--protein ligase
VTGCLASALEPNVERVTLGVLVRGNIDGDVLAFPGGADRPWLEPLAGRGNDNIRRFVESGGTFLGVCAGAYYACRRIDFDGVGLRTVADRDLGLFPGTGIGPLVKLAPRYAEDEAKCAAATRITHAGGEMIVLYWGGCRFVVDDDAEEVEVLARYADLPPGDDVAAVRCRVGKGVAVLVGFHPEVDTAAFAASYGIDLSLSPATERLAFLRNALQLSPLR